MNGFVPEIHSRTKELVRWNEREHKGDTGVKRQQVRKIIVVFKTHFDIGFTGLASEIIRSYSTGMLPEVVRTCEATGANPERHRFVWTMPAWPLVHSLASGDTPEEVKARAADLIRRGQIRWHALPFTTHTEFCGLEEFIRGMYFSRKLAAEFGFAPTAAKMTDVPGHTRMLPSLLHQAGVRFLHLGCNPFSTPPEVPVIFRWEGPDGRQVVTFYNKGEYGSSLVPPDDWPFPVWLALMNTGDNEGPQKPEAIVEILREVERVMPGAEVVMGTLDDFYAEIEPFADRLPVVRGDLADSWIHGVGTYPEEVGRLRRLRQTLADTEKALTAALAAGVIGGEDAAALKRGLDRAYEESILFGEHTWGMDVKKMGEHREYRKDRFRALKTTELYHRMERSWEEKRERVRAAAAATEAVCRRVMERLAAHAAGSGTPGGESGAASAAGVGPAAREAAATASAGLPETGPEGRPTADFAGADGLIAFNGLGWTRDIWVDLSGRLPAGGAVPVDAATGVPLALRTVEGRTEALVRAVPPFGCRMIRWDRAASRPASPAPRPASSLRAADGTLENRWYRLTVDPEHGVVRSLQEKASGYDWVDGTPDVPGFGQYRYDVYGDRDITEFLRAYAYRFYTWGIIDFGRAGYPRQDHRTFVPARFRTETIREDGSATIVMTAGTDPVSTGEYGNATEVSLSVTLYEDEPYIDMEMRLSGKEETPFVESGHLALPIRLKGARVAIQKLGQVVDPAADIVEGANHVLYCCDRWVDIGNGERGLAVIPLDTPLFSLGEIGLLRFRPAYREGKPTLLFNLFNNCWGTNFPQWMGGNYRFRFRLLPHAGSWRDADVPRHAAEAFAPALVGAVRFAGGPDGAGTAGSAPAAWPAWTDGLLEADRGLELLCFKPAEDGDGLVLRLADTLGIARNVRVAFRRRPRSAVRCNLLEMPLEPCELAEGALAFATRPFEIHTFKLVF